MKVAVVTGTARTAGIGHAICSTLLSKGLAVIGFDTLPIESSSPLPIQYPDRFRSRTCRVDSDPINLRNNLLSALEELGEKNVSVVVNNAGISSPLMPDEEESAVHDTEDGGNGNRNEEEELLRLQRRLEQYDDYIRNNLRSAFMVSEVCKPFFPPPIVQEIHRSSTNSSSNPSAKPTTIHRPMASIVHISSTRAHSSEFGPPHAQEGYASAKSGMIGLTHSQGQALAGRARVNVILPGWIDTEGDGGYVPSGEDHAWHAAGRVGRPEDVADLVEFLADGERSGFVTCQEFVVDGGVSKRMCYP